MKKLLKKYSLGAALLAVLCLLPTSCIKDDVLPTDKASVTLTFTTKATASGESELPVSEQMKNLRVIMVNRETRKVLYNVTREITDAATSYTIKFGDVAVSTDGTDFDFYAIANEGSLALTDEAQVALKSAQGSTLAAGALDDAVLGTNGFVNPPNENQPLPQTAKATLKVKADAGNTLTMPLKFVCAKVLLTFHNKIEEAAQTVSNIQISNINPTSGYLFEKQLTSTDKTLRFDNVTIPVGTLGNPTSSATSTKYVYPSSSATYNLTANWGARTQTLPLVLTDGTVPRGKLLSIQITLLPNENDFDFEVNVLPWSAAAMTIPPFE